MSPFISRAFDNLGIIFPSLIRGTFLSITTLDSSKNEGDAGATAFTFSILRTGNLNVTSSVNWAVNVTGLTNPAAPSDFVGGLFPGGTANFAIGVDRVDITVNVAGDTVVEPDENFNVTLDLPINAEILPGQGSTSGIILNDDVAPPPPPPPPAPPPPPPPPAAFTYPLTIGVFCVGAGGGGGFLGGVSGPSAGAGGGAGGAVANQPSLITLPSSGLGLDILVNCGTGGGVGARGTFSAAAITPSTAAPAPSGVTIQVTAAGGGGGGAGGPGAGSQGDPGANAVIGGSPLASRTATGSLIAQSNGAGGGGAGSGGAPGGQPGQNATNTAGINVQSGGGGAGCQGGAPGYTFPNAGPGGPGVRGNNFFPPAAFPLKRVNGYGGGGGGGTSSGSGSAGNGGNAGLINPTGGGRGGSLASGAAQSGAPNSGTGGGGGYRRLFGANQGSSGSGTGGPGVVYIRYPGNSSTNTILTSLTGCSAAVSPNGFVYIRFNNSGETRRGLK